MMVADDRTPTTMLTVTGYIKQKLFYITARGRFKTAFHLWIEISKGTFEIPHKMFDASGEVGISLVSLLLAG